MSVVNRLGHIGKSRVTTRRIYGYRVGRHGMLLWQSSHSDFCAEYCIVSRALGRPIQILSRQQMVDDLHLQGMLGGFFFSEEGLVLLRSS